MHERNAPVFRIPKNAEMGTRHAHSQSNRRHRALTSLVKADVAFGESDHASPALVPSRGGACDRPYVLYARASL